MAARGGSPEVAPGSGCSVHRTPQGQVCEYCRRQPQLFTRAQVLRQTRGERGGGRSG